MRPVLRAPSPPPVEGAVTLGFESFDLTDDTFPAVSIARSFDATSPLACLPPSPLAPNQSSRGRLPRLACDAVEASDAETSDAATFAVDAAAESEEEAIRDLAFLRLRA